MKNFVCYIVLSAIGSLIQTQSFAQETRKILEGKIRVAVIESAPTRPEEQKPGQEYVFDYHILRYLTVSEAQAAEIKTLVNTRKGFDAQNVKSCLFQPGYAIVGDTKTKWFPLYYKARGEVIVSTGQCGKSILVQNGKDTYSDLGQNNALEQILDNLK